MIISGRPVGFIFQGSISPRRAQISFSSRRKPEMTQKQVFVFYYCPTLNVYFESVPNFCNFFYIEPLCEGCISTKLRTVFFMTHVLYKCIASDHSVPNWKHFCLKHTYWSSVFDSNVEWEAYIGRHGKCMTSFGRKMCQAETTWRACVLLGRYSNSRINYVWQIWCRYVKWIHLVQDRDDCQAFVNTVMILGVTQSVDSGS